MKRLMLGVLAVTAGAVLAGCGSRESSETNWRAVQESAMTAEQQELKERALQARSELFGKLSRELSEAREAAGAEGAVSVCREAAPRIAREVSAEYDLRIGRTSYRLRNPANAAPGWAGDAVKARTEDPAFFIGQRGTLAVLLPIRMAAMCVDCHGPADHFTPELEQALATTYPQDKATGFIPGDLRGWFWVEVDP